MHPGLKDIERLLNISLDKRIGLWGLYQMNKRSGSNPHEFLPWDFPGEIPTIPCFHGVFPTWFPQWVFMFHGIYHFVPQLCVIFHDISPHFLNVPSFFPIFPNCFPHFSSFSMLFPSMSPQLSPGFPGAQPSRSPRGLRLQPGPARSPQHGPGAIEALRLSAGGAQDISTEGELHLWRGGKMGGDLTLKNGGFMVFEWDITRKNGGFIAGVGKWLPWLGNIKDITKNSSHKKDHIPIMVGWCETWGHLMTHVSEGRWGHHLTRGYPIIY